MLHLGVDTRRTEEHLVEELAVLVEVPSPELIALGAHQAGP
jgi:hypothetical protein